ncbi:MAG: diacylglycerol kinase family protein [Planctomycetota bacterium]
MTDVSSADESAIERIEARRVWVIVNPRAGRGLAATVARTIVSDLRRSGVATSLTQTHPAETVSPSGDHDAVLVIGGDGTVRAAVERLLQLGMVPPILPVPMGTANLLGRHLGLRRTLWNVAMDGVRESASRIVGSGRLGRRVMRIGRRTLLPGPRRLAKTISHDACRALSRGMVRRLDIGRVEGRGPFLLMASVGFDAQVVAELDRRRSRSPGPIGLTSYALPAASALLSRDVPAITVTVDGQRVFGPAPAIAMVANMPEYGAGFPIAPDAISDDGLLDVVCLPCDGPMDVVKWFTLAAIGRHVDADGVVRAKGSEVTIASNAEDTPVQIDGDPGGVLPITTRVEKHSVPFVLLHPDGN